jgi:hypothetical protein
VKRRVLFLVAVLVPGKLARRRVDAEAGIDLAAAVREARSRIGAVR